MTIQWIIVGVIVAVCVVLAVRGLWRRRDCGCGSCPVKDCCKNPRRKL